MAAVWKAPVVFVCENNQYMEYTPIGDVTAVEHPAADRAAAYGLESIVVDGNDVDAVFAVATTADRARPGRRRAVARRGRDLPPRRPLAGRSRQVPARTTRSRPGRRATRSRPTGRGSRRPASTAAELDAIEAETRDAVAAAEAEARAAPGAGRGRPRDPGLDRRGLGVAELTYRAAIAAGIAQEMRRDRAVVLIGEDVGAAGGVFKLTEGLFDEFGPRARPRHADQRAGHRRCGDGRGDDRPAPDRRADVLRLLRGDLGHGRQPDRQDALHDRRPGLAPARAPDRQRRRPPVRGAAQPERRELGDGDPRAQGRRAVDAGRRGRPHGRRHPRPGPGHLLRAQGAVRDQGRGARRRDRRHARARRAIVRDGRGRDDRGAGGDGPAGRSRPPTAWPRTTASTPRSSTCARSSRSTPPTILASVAKTSRLFTVEENPRLCGWGAEIASIVADEGFYSLDAPIVRITTPHIPLPSAAALEDLAIPSVERIVDTVAPATGRTRREACDRWLSRPSRSLGPGRMGSAMAERLAGRDVAVVVYNRSPDRAHALAERIGARVAGTPAEAAAGADVVDLDGRRRRCGRRRCTTGPDGVAGGHPAGRGGGRHEHGPARHDPGDRAGASARAARASSTRPCRAASRSTLSGRADDHGRRRGGRPRARPAGPRRARAGGSSTSGRWGPGRR